MRKPLHVRAAEALGWQDCYPALDGSCWYGFAPAPWRPYGPWTVWMKVPR